MSNCCKRNRIKKLFSGTTQFFQALHILVLHTRTIYIYVYVCMYIYIYIYIYLYIYIHWSTYNNNRGCSNIPIVLLGSTWNTTASGHMGNPVLMHFCKMNQPLRSCHPWIQLDLYSHDCGVFESSIVGMGSRWRFDLPFPCNKYHPEYSNLK